MKRNGFCVFIRAVETKHLIYSEINSSYPKALVSKNKTQDSFCTFSGLFDSKRFFNVKPPSFELIILLNLNNVRWRYLWSSYRTLCYCSWLGLHLISREKDGWSPWISRFKQTLPWIGSWELWSHKITCLSSMFSTSSLLVFYIQ